MPSVTVPRGNPCWNVAYLNIFCMWLVRKLNIKITGPIRVGDEQSNKFALEKGVGEGCLLSTMFFYVVGEKNHALGRRRDARERRESII